MPVLQDSSGNPPEAASANRAQKAADETASKLVEAGNSKGATTNTKPSTDDRAEADRRYEEAMEDEYAKREGGA